MSARRKLPPYGAKLLQQRDDGQLPDLVWVIFGRDCWERRPVGAPALCIPSDTYEPDRYDWTPVAGLPVHVVWRDGDRAAISPLVAELAQATAPVTVHFFGDGSFEYGLNCAYQLDASLFLFETFFDDTCAGVWDEQKQDDYHARTFEYLRALQYTIEQSAEAS